jgi:anti-anti-sigma factor
MLRWKVNQTSDKVVTVAVDGSLDRYSTPPLARLLNHELPRVSPGTEEVVLDLSHVDSFDSQALNLVLHVEREVRGGGRKLSLITGANRVRRVLRHTGLAAQFNMDGAGAVPEDSPQ